MFGLFPRIQTPLFTSPSFSLSSSMFDDDLNRHTLSIGLQRPPPFRDDKEMQSLHNELSTLETKSQVQLQNMHNTFQNTVQSIRDKTHEEMDKHNSDFQNNSNIIKNKIQKRLEKLYKTQSGEPDKESSYSKMSQNTFSSINGKEESSHRMSEKKNEVDTTSLFTEASKTKDGVREKTSLNIVSNNDAKKIILQNIKGEEKALDANGKTKEDIVKEIKEFTKVIHEKVDDKNKSDVDNVDAVENNKKSRTIKSSSPKRVSSPKSKQTKKTRVNKQNNRNKSKRALKQKQK